jgi:parallel beta-helix repeat protein
MKTTIVSSVALAIVSAFCILHSALGQGALTPPSAPAPTMKSLDQVEARTPVDAIHTPGGASDEFIISQPGSYYLTTNIVGVSSKRGINISNNNVTLDLNGFALLGNPSSLDAIFVNNIFTNITIRNGRINGWAAAFGVRCFAPYTTVERLTVTGNLNGVDCAASNCVVRDCIVSGNSKGGIFVVISGGSLVTGNVCVGNNSSHDANSAGISISGFNNRIDGNHVTGSGTGGYGITVEGGTGNIIIRNSVEGGGTNYIFDATQIVGPLITNTVSGIITNSNPWANFSF